MTLIKLKANEDLFNRWQKLAKLTTVKMSSISIIQNDMETSKAELNKWYKDSKEEIIKVDQKFNEIVGELLSTRNEIMAYIKEQIEEA